MRARRLSSRFILLIGIPACLFLGALMTWIAFRLFDRSAEDAKNTVQISAKMVSGIFERSFNRAAMVARNHAILIESGVLTEEKQITDYLKSSIQNHPSIYGATLAFAENTFFPQRRIFSPYVYWESDTRLGFKDLGVESYNTQKQEWFALPKATLKPAWSDPYEDKGGGETWMTTYSVPFFRPHHEKNAANFWGVATADLSLYNLSTNLKALPIPGSGYGFLISKNGTVVLFNDEGVVIREPLSVTHPTLAEIAAGSTSGLISAEDPFRGGKAWIAFQPLQQGNLHFVVVYPQAEAMLDALRTRDTLILIGVLAMLGLFTAMYFLSQSVTRPIGDLANTASQIANGDLNRTFETTSPIREVHDLTRSFQKMMVDLQARIDDLQIATATEARIRGELNAAHLIQMSMLPSPWETLCATKNESHLAMVKAIHLHASIQSAREVGGDFYHYEFLDETHLGLLIGDVSGKGIPAAMFMAMTSTFFKSLSKEMRSSSELLARVNNALCDQNHTGMFVTLMYGIVDLAKGTVDLCNAGHIAPICLDQDGQCIDVSTPKNPALGLIRDFQFCSATYDLIPGCRWIAFTDGVTEALNPEKQLLGMESFRKMLYAYRHLSLNEMCEALTQDVKRFTNNEALTDDLTLLAIEYAPINAKSDTNETRS